MNYFQHWQHLQQLKRGFMSNFYSKALDLGLSVMPIDALTGRPVLSEWRHLNDNLPTDDEAEQWDKFYPVGNKYGIALICGPASGIIAIDDDSENIELRNIIPKSIYSKRGLPGRMTAFFKYRKGVLNIGEGSTGVRIQASASYTILPPSKHRKFDGSYVWVGKSLFDLDRDELPDFPSLEWYEKLPQQNQFIEISEGRNDHLKRMIVAMRHDGKSEEEIVRFVYDYDLKNHSPRLFTDPKEQFKAKNEDEALRAAHKMVSNVTASLLRTRADIKLPFQKKEIEIITDIDRFTPRTLPLPESGIIRSFVDAANASSNFDISALALGGALSLLSVLAANRFTLNGTYPNIYVLALAKSGSGKGIIPIMLKDLLGDHNLIGSESYRSTQSFIQNLPKQSERLDVMDECRGFFDAMRSTNTYTSDLADTVNALFSTSKTKYGGISSIKHGIGAGACWNPCVSIYASTHAEGFLSTVHSYLGASGLLPRFIVIESQKPEKDSYRDEDMNRYESIMDNLREHVRFFLSMNPIDYGLKPGEFLLDQASKRPRPKPMTIDKESKELLMLYKKQYRLMSIEGWENSDSSYLARIHENVEKVTLLSAMSHKRTNVIKSDVTWAIELIEACYHNAELIRTQVVNSGRVTGPMSKVFSYLRRKGSMSRVDLIRSVDMRAFELDSILKPLIEEGEIQEYKVTSGQRLRTYYKINSQKCE